MRKKINVVTTILFILCCVAAVYCGWIDDDKIGTDSRTWYYCVALLCLALVIGIVRFALLLKVRKVEKDCYIPIRSVKLADGVEVDDDGNEHDISDTAVLIHTDTVASDKVVIRLFKNPVPVVDSASKVND